MKVMFVSIGGMLNEVHGGTEYTMLESAKWLRARGHEVKFVCAVHSNARLQALRAMRLLTAKRIRAFTDVVDGIPVARVYPDVSDDGIFVRALGTQIARYKPDVIVTWGRGSGSAILSASAACGRSIPVLASIHVALEPDKDLLAAGDLVRWRANSPFTQQWLAGFGLSSTVIYPPVNRVRLTAKPTSPDRVLYFTLREEKGVDTAIDVAEALPGVRFTFVRGWGQDSAEHRARARKLPNVSIVPQTRLVGRYFSRAMLLLAPSRLETFGRAVLEAHMLGIPVVGSDAQALPATIGGGGIVVPLGSPTERWVAAVTHALYEPRWRMLSQKARENAERPEFDMNRSCEQFEALLRDMC